MTATKRWITAIVLGGLVLAACGNGLAEDATGEEIYEARCASCHRGDLSGGIGPPLGPESDAAGKPDDFYRLTINQGLGRMPSFGGVFNDDQVTRVIEYLRSAQAEGE